ncbi:hypothetical protein [Candidatus Palauibacter sp.]|uniref:hypothetical protein n=1 Tax=Candidatus Palauibacter sp. TaxID=3101350 RepID=UPI003B01DB47
MGLPAVEVHALCEAVAADVAERLHEIVAATRAEGLDDAILDRLEERIGARAMACQATMRA